MRAVFFFPLIASLSGAISASAGSVVAMNSTITQVTVYEDRARVTREVSIDIPAGASVLQIPGLSQNLDENSIEVSGMAAEPLRIQGVSLRKEFLVASANPKVKNIQEQIQQLEDQKRSYESQKLVLQDQRIFFRNLSLGLGRSDKGTVGLDEVRGLYGYYSDQLNTISRQILSLEVEERKLEPALEQLRSELGPLSTTKIQKTLEISVQSQSAATAKLQIRYWMSGAFWQPSYLARVESTSGKVQLNYNALVRQNTGEDWNGVKLSLSTAKPGQNGRMPEFEPEYLNFVPVEPPTPAMAAAPNAAAPMAKERKPEMATRSYAALDQPISQEEAKIQNLGLSVSYEVALPATIPSDNQPHQTSLAELHFQGTPIDVSTPKLDPAAYLKVHVANNSSGPLLPGRVDIFRDGDSVGNLALENIPASAEFDLFCGRDDAVKIERKELVNNESQTGLINRKRAKQKRYQTTVQNFRADPVKITIYDQRPISQDAQITVDQEQFSDKPSSIDANTGKITWDLALQSKEKKVLTFGYIISWPEGKRLESTD